MLRSLLEYRLVYLQVTLRYGGPGEALGVGAPRLPQPGTLRGVGQQPGESGRETAGIPPLHESHHPAVREFRLRRVGTRGHYGQAVREEREQGATLEGETII